LISEQIAIEATPDDVRRRLGVWEGPLDDPSRRFVLLQPGNDDARVENDVRRDDPRVEANSNIMARLSCWHHLWLGFAPDEPFPFVEARLGALTSQLSESVVLMPGQAADAFKAELARLAALPIEAHAARLPLEVEDLQPQVRGILGKAYGEALRVVGQEYQDKIKAAAQQDELDASYSVDFGVDEDFEADSEDLPEMEDDEYDDEDDDEDEDEEKAAEDDVSHGGVWMGEEAGEEEPVDPAVGVAPEALTIDEPTEEDVVDPNSLPTSPSKEDKEITPWLEDLIEKADPTAWAVNQLRPLSPSDTPRNPTFKPGVPLPKKPYIAQEFNKLWTDNEFLLQSMVRPWVGDLGLRLIAKIDADRLSEFAPPLVHSFDTPRCVLERPAGKLESTLVPLPPPTPRTPSEAAFDDGTARESSKLTWKDESGCGAVA
jgi:hypothetical protein